MILFPSRPVGTEGHSTTENMVFTIGLLCPCAVQDPSPSIRGSQEVRAEAVSHSWRATAKRYSCVDDVLRRRRGDGSAKTTSLETSTGIVDPRLGLPGEGIRLARSSRSGIGTSMKTPETTSWSTVCRPCDRRLEIVSALFFLDLYHAHPRGTHTKTSRLVQLSPTSWRGPRLGLLALCRASSKWEQYKELRPTGFQ